VIILILITWLISINFSCRNYKIFNILTWLFPYIAILILLSLFKKYKIIRVLYTLLWIPGLILAATGPFIQTIGSLIFTYITILGGTCILVFILPKEVFNYHIVFEAGVYLVLTISSIAATTFSEQLIKNWHNAQNKEYKDFSEKLSLKLFGQNKIRFIIFIFYFILLTIFTFSKLNRISILEQHNLDIAILQSFATYVAFDRVVSNWDKLKNGLSK
jgi:hypothetical protein